MLNISLKPITRAADQECLLICTLFLASLAFDEIYLMSKNLDL